MKPSPLLFAACFSLLVLYVAAAPLLQENGSSTLMDDPLVVNTRSGPVRGKYDVITNTKVRQFFGIPYAAPPVGDLRWASPQREASWSTVRS